MEVEKKKAQIPETLQKKTVRNEKISALRAKLAQKRKDRNKVRYSEYVTRAQKYLKEYEAQEKEIINLKRQARSENAVFVPPEARVLFVVRIRGISNLPPKCKKILRLFRLRQLNNGVFVKVNKATVNMLQAVLPYITYGQPTRALVSKLVYKRGYGKVEGQRIPLTSNLIIEKVLGKYNIISIEDLIHEIVTVGPHFKEANNFLWPIKLRNPKGGFVAKRNSYLEGGDWGNREEQINDLVAKML